MSVEKLENLLNRNEIGELGEIVERARDFARLTEAIRAALPEDLREGLVAASIATDGGLVVFGRSPAWAAKLRYESETLIDAARAIGEKVSNVKLRVSQQIAESQRPD